MFGNDWVKCKNIRNIKKCYELLQKILLNESGKDLCRLRQCKIYWKWVGNIQKYYQYENVKGYDKKTVKWKMERKSKRAEL